MNARLSFLMLMMVAVLACSKDDLSPESDIVNGANDRWYLFEVTEAWTGEVTEYTVADALVVFQFDLDGSFTKTLAAEGCTVTGTYTQDANGQYILSYDPQPVDCNLAYAELSNFFLENDELIYDGRAYDGLKLVFEKH